MKCLTLLCFGLAIAIAPRRAIAQTDSSHVVELVHHAGAALDSARHNTKALFVTVQNAEIAYSVAQSLLRDRDYVGARRLAAMTTRLVGDAQRGPIEIGPHVDSIPFGVKVIPAGVPPGKAGIPVY